MTDQAPVDDTFLQSKFYLWYLKNQPIGYEEERALRDEALITLVESVNAGEITSLDGVGSPLSGRMKAHHRLESFEMNSNWMGSSQNWLCPCCARSKFQISRIGNKQQIVAKLVVHHDHMHDALEEEFHKAFASTGTSKEQVEGLRLVERMANAFAAYEEVLICEDCNNADARAKKGVSAPRHFSFSPGQIRQFIRSADHRAHEVDMSMAQVAWDEAKPAYDLRMEIIRSVAHAAATSRHWYEPYSRQSCAVPVFGYGAPSSKRFGDHMIQKWVIGEALFKALGPQTPVAKRDLSQWRTANANRRAGKPPPPNFLAMLRSERTRAERWDSIVEDWHCPICRRSKHEATYVGDKGKIGFYLHTHPGRGQWKDIAAICNHCFSTLTSLKWEVEEKTGQTLPDSYTFVRPDELSEIIAARPHSVHCIRKLEAAQLVSRLVAKLNS